ncbi:putative colanic acid biosynthesis UDP-glucose lipid carrier transferase [Povalibacter uvarum]|uniref:Putative colanic acid biosynthesis UDP-glucose lipid carrier transferase n=1 Tax=Povalibacter uvarum TaxID=732238 RepID=A0A841HPI8_9GAMM|nr:undecaprenyl-phosphate glucose phosphotransferase [Povalibacter uvarum]MBB6094693.1 putative colanic acid biosynthesis UDP-glucose lipid carrier transferase [Povalibacter uvarum]
MSSTGYSTRSSVPAIGQRAWRDRAGDVSASEPFSIFALKSLLYPIIPVITLMLCLAFWGKSLYGPYILVAVLSFLGVADLLDVVPLRITPASVMALRSLLDILLRWGVLMVFLWLLLGLSYLSHHFSKPVLMTWAISTPFALWIGELVAQQMLLRRSKSKARLRKAVIVGANDLALQLEQNIGGRPTLQISVGGYFEDRAVARVPDECVGRVLGSLHEVAEYVTQHNVDIVYITLPMVPQPRILDLLNSLRDSTASIYFVPDLKVFDLVQPRFDLVDGIPVIAVCESPYYGVRGLLKRMSDVFISGTALLLLTPVLVAVAIGVKVSSAGPVIYRQRRYGLDGKEIIVYKFRSLSVVEDGATSYTQVGRNDPRVTPFGAFIRKTSLDELPQLFNVLRGDMSIVGPRPHAVAVNEQYRRQIPGYMVRHKVKPGITGWAQVNGYRGGDDLDSMTMRIRYDIEYLRHWSLGLDLIIMLKTASIIWNDRHAY